jgi:hypothetical protein
MGIVNKRNALLGWLTWRVGKGIAKKKVKSAVPVPGKSQSGGSRKPALFAGIAAAVGGAAWLRRKRKSGEEHSGD